MCYTSLVGNSLVKTHGGSFWIFPPVFCGIEHWHVRVFPSNQILVNHFFCLGNNGCWSSSKNLVNHPSLQAVIYTLSEKKREDPICLSMTCFLFESEGTENTLNPPQMKYLVVCLCIHSFAFVFAAFFHSYIFIKVWALMQQSRQTFRANLAGATKNPTEWWKKWELFKGSSKQRSPPCVFGQLGWPFAPKKSNFPVSARLDCL